MAKADDKATKVAADVEATEPETETQEIPKKVTKGDVKKYYAEAPGGASFQQVADHFGIEVSVVQDVLNPTRIKGVE